MIVLDTNVLVPVITKDDIDQATQAFALLQGAGPFWISRVVLLETAWTLKSRHGTHGRRSAKRCMSWLRSKVWRSRMETRFAGR